MYVSAKITTYKPNLTYPNRNPTTIIINVIIIIQQKDAQLLCRIHVDCVML